MSHGIYGNTVAETAKVSLSLIGEVSSLEEVRGGGRGREREASFLFCATGQCWLHSTLAAKASWSLNTKQSSVIQAHAHTNVNLINIQTVV